MESSWTVLLIGGSSGLGKTYLAQQLAEHFGISHMETDDLRVALRTVTTREAHPELFTFVDNQNYLAEFTTEQFIEGHLASAKTVWGALDAIITKHVEFSERILFDGDSILPVKLATRSQEAIKAIFLYDDVEYIRERQIKRNRNKKRTPEKIETNARFSFEYGETLRKQAEENGFLTIKASPINTLFDRVIAAVT